MKGYIVQRTCSHGTRTFGLYMGCPRDKAVSLLRQSGQDVPWAWSVICSSLFPLQQLPDWFR